MARKTVAPAKSGAIIKIADVPHLVPKGRANPKAAFPEIRLLAASENWGEREVAATALVEISKKQADAVVAEMLNWARDPNPNIRRTASEGLRGIARTKPDAVIPVLELLRADAALYVRKSVANVLRNAGKKNPEFILDLCRRWAKLGNPHTDWIVKDGLRKLRESDPEPVERVVKSLGKR
jgi:3-methyladenine DNA glycosylase AlkC